MDALGGVSDMSYGCCRFVLLIVWGWVRVVCMLLYVWLVDAFGICGGCVRDVLGWLYGFTMYDVGLRNGYFRDVLLLLYGVC